MPEVEEYPENVVLDSRRGVRLSILSVRPGKEKGAAQKPLHRAHRPIKIAKEQSFDCSFTYECSVALRTLDMVTRRGFEPRTHGLKGSCSTG